MKIYLAGQNGAHWIIPTIHGGDTDMIVFLAGGISGNLKLAWSRTAKGEDISQEQFIKALYDENFWQGGSHSIGYKT